MRRLGLIAAVLLLASCSGGGDNRDDGAEAPGDAACEDVYATGESTDELVEREDLCLDGDEPTLVASASYDCEDGRELHWNDYGWGYAGDEWHAAGADGDNPPADENDRCQNGPPPIEADEPGATADNPLALGEAVTLEDYEIAVVEFTGDSTSAVVAANQFNDPPADGSVYALVRIRATYNGEDEGSALFDLNIGYVGADKRIYEECDAVEPDSLSDQPDVVSGGTVEGNACIELPREVLGTGAIFVELTVSFDETKVWWAEA